MFIAVKFKGIYNTHYVKIFLLPIQFKGIYLEIKYFTNIVKKILFRNKNQATSILLYI